MAPTLGSQLPPSGSRYFFQYARAQLSLLRGLRISLCLCVMATMLMLVWLGLGLPSNATQYHVAKYSSIPPSQGRFPRKIWQTWKHAPPSFSEEDLERAMTWTEKNPEWRWEVLTDANELEYVQHHFGPHGFNRPDIIEFFRTVSITIIKADVLRYLVMYVEGGLYADIDVEARKSIPEFIPKTFDEAEIDMVIGIETDEPKFKHHPILGAVARTFCQWTFMCKPQLPFLIKLVDDAMARLHDLAKQQGVPLPEVSLDFNQVIECTGPGVFTDVIIQYMNEQRIQGPPITWDNFHHMEEAILVGRILVLPVKAFAAGQTHSRSGATHDIPTALVKHHYSVSNWTSQHSRYKHPVYGELNECCFNETCVKQWDINVKAYEDFPNKGELN